MEKDKNKYDASSLEVLKGLEGIRMRPSMYIGSTSKEGLHHLVWEIVDNSVDEALAGFCSKIKVTLQANGFLTVSDDGRGIPIDVNQDTGVSGVETILTNIHAGGKFNSKTYKISGGLHGVGASVVNALSSELEVIVFRNNKKYYQKYIDGGEPVSPLKEVIKTLQDKATGTTLSFIPDEKIFTSGIAFDYNVLKKRLRELAFLTPKLEINLVDEINDFQDTFYYENGIQEFVCYINETASKLHDKNFYLNKTLEDIGVEICLQYTKTDWCKVYSYCNNILTIHGGTHEDGFRYALTKIINNYAKKQGLLDSKISLIYDDIKEGLTAIICIKHMDPQYEGQTKGKLGNTEVRRIVNTLLSESLEKFFLENPQTAVEIVEKCVLSYKARLAAKKARENTKRKTALNNFNLPGKLADCISNKVEECELYIVEGDSAGTTAKLGRDRQYQAIIPLKGKVLNVERATEEKIYVNSEILSLISAIGAGFHETFNVKNIKYNKIIIMTDADVDGSHIKVLLLTLFYRYMYDLIFDGHVYVSCPPLYRVFNSKKSYYASEDDIDEKIKLLNTDKYVLQRFKGLGEMNADQLWDTTMNPLTRKLIKIQISDVVDADRSFSNLMGKDTDLRKKFIFEKSDDNLELDI